MRTPQNIYKYILLTRLPTLPDKLTAKLICFHLLKQTHALTGKLIQANADERQVFEYLNMASILYSHAHLLKSTQDTR